MYVLVQGMPHGFWQGAFSRTPYVLSSECLLPLVQGHLPQVTHKFCHVSVYV